MCRPALYFSILLGLAISLVGCGSMRTSADREATALGFKSVYLGPPGSELEAYVHRSPIQQRELHVYLEGDGQPWLTPHVVSANPNTHNPLMLRLMARDPEASIYLVRPCYGTRMIDWDCHPGQWTSARYSLETVTRMALALDQYARENGITRLVLIGHSGGGALAILIANRLPKVVGVVTLSGNLDTDAWTRYHHYSPLTGSINPMLDPKLQAYGEEHFLAEKDLEIPLEVSLPAANARVGAQVTVIKGIDHSCCWEQVWQPAFLLKPTLLSGLGDRHADSENGAGAPD